MEAMNFKSSRLALKGLIEGTTKSFTVNLSGLVENPDPQVVAQVQEAINMLTLYPTDTASAVVSYDFV